MADQCEHCRQVRQKLFLKGDRCFSQKCAVARKTYGPGQHGATSRQKISEYGRQLHEKQKAKAVYGLNEGQLRRIFVIANTGHGEVGENLLRLFETRLDNVLFRSGFYPSRNAARQAVVHGKVKVDGVKTTIPSFIVAEGAKVKITKLNANAEISKEAAPPWLKSDKNKLETTIIHNPTPEELITGLQEKLIVESLSR